MICYRVICWYRCPYFTALMLQREAKHEILHERDGIPIRSRFTCSETS